MENEKQRKARKDFEGLFKKPFQNFGGCFLIVIFIVWLIS